MRIGIDGTNLGGGGGITHLKEILTNFNQEIFKDVIKSVIVFSSDKVLEQIPDYEFIHKVSFLNLNSGLLKRIWFQLTQYDKEIKQRCDILFSITGDYIGNFKPVVGMSQNMLLYERDIWKEIKQPKEILRFWLNYQKQKKCFNNTTGIIFISNYAKEYVSRVLNLEMKTKNIVHHGISPRFKGNVKVQKEISEYSHSNPFRMLYVSTVHVYKHQWNVVRAVGKLRRKGYPIELNLVGGIIFAPAGEKLNQAINEIDPKSEFIHNHGHVPYENIETFYKTSDGIVYASSCENMPNILIESMASGVPIACSQKQPMPEFLKENGFYFDSYNIDSIEEAIEKLLLNPKQREFFARNNLKEASQFSWEKASKATFNTLLRAYKDK